MARGSHQGPPKPPSPPVINDGAHTGIPSPELPFDSDGEQFLVDDKMHDELVVFLDLAASSTVVARAKPKPNIKITFARWLNNVLTSKRVSSWHDVLKNLKHEPSMVDALDDIDSIYDYLIQTITPDAIKGSSASGDHT